MACPYSCRDFLIQGKMDIETRLAQDALFLDCRDILFSGSMIQEPGRQLLLEIDIDRKGMALIGANLRPISAEAEALLIIRTDEFPQAGLIDLVLAGGIDARNEFLHIRPAMLVQMDSGFLRPMPQNHRDEFACLSEVYIHSLASLGALGAILLRPFFSFRCLEIVDWLQYLDDLCRIANDVQNIR